MANRYEEATTGTVLPGLSMDLLSTAELAALLKCSPRTLRTLHHRGVLRPIRIGRCFRFDVRETIEALSSPAVR
jgi:excisionase family DNA binding protein